MSTDTGATVTLAATRSFIGAQVMDSLTVEGVHTFDVYAGDTFVLVHNTNCSPAGSRPGRPFTSAGKEKVWDENEQQYGTPMCDTRNLEGCGQALAVPQQSQWGVTPPGNEGHVDHVVRRSVGGSGTPENGPLLCGTCNVIVKH